LTHGHIFSHNDKSVGKHTNQKVLQKSVYLFPAAGSVN